MSLLALAAATEFAVGWRFFKGHKLLVQPAERADAMDDVQKNKGGRAKCADQQNLICDARKQDFAHRAEQRQKSARTGGEREVVDSLLPIPLHCSVFEAEQQVIAPA